MINAKHLLWIIPLVVLVCLVAAVLLLERRDRKNERQLGAIPPPRYVPLPPWHAARNDIMEEKEDD
jgi:hypothetical protein